MVLKNFMDIGKCFVQKTKRYGKIACFEFHIYSRIRSLMEWFGLMRKQLS